VRLLNERRKKAVMKQENKLKHKENENIIGYRSIGCVVEWFRREQK
jgi:hypothetical protein